MKRLAVRVGLSLGGVLLGLLLGLAVVQAFPQLLPPALRDPLSQRTRNRTWEVTYTLTDGDLFYHQAGDVKPPAQNEILSQHSIYWDEDGFRQPALTAEHYPILALGDSFTEAWMVAQPWTDVLAAELDTPVRNLAYRGYGPLEYRAMMEDFGTGEHEWILMGFFEGNDLQNIATSIQGRETGKNVLADLLEEAFDPPQIEVIENPEGNYRYPLALYIGSDFYELAFYDFYLWILNGEPETYAESRNLRELKTVLEDIAEMSGEACLGFVYLPAKEHIYFPYAEPYGRRWIVENATYTEIGADGWLSGEPHPENFEQMIGRFDNMRTAVAEVVTAVGWEFIDLTPVFQAAQNQMLYLTYDTHWNQAGQILAGQTVADYIQNHEGLCGAD